MIIKIKGGATAAKGFSAAACEAGIKYKDRTDMAMLYAEGMCRAAGTFTTNVVKAAPVLWDRKVVYEKGKYVFHSLLPVCFSISWGIIV